MQHQRRRWLLGAGAACLLASPMRQGAGLASAMPGASPPRQPGTADLAAWQEFRDRWLSPDGRIGAGGTALTQAMGLLLAESADDAASFGAILGWTRRSLGRPADSLHAAHPGASRGTTEADLLVALALLRAGSRWQRPEWLAAGRQIGRDLLRLVVREGGGRLLLLPCAEADISGDRVTLHPGGWVLPALRALGAAVPDPAWARLEADCLGLLRAARFGPRGLPPDRLEISRRSGGIGPAGEAPPRFGAEAARAVLHLVWAGLPGEPMVRAAHTAWSARVPAWIDVLTEATAAEPAGPGIRAIAALAAAALTPNSRRRPALPSAESAADAEAAGLVLLTRLAARESGLALA